MKIINEKINTSLRNIKIFLFIMFTSSFALAQTPVTYTAGPTNDQINTMLQGSNVAISGGTLNLGVRNRQFATFTDGTAAGLSMADGVYLSTGDITKDLTATTATLSEPIGSGGTNIVAADADLSTIDATCIFDVASYSFTVTMGPKATVLNIAYQFGSEEYPNFVGSVFDDAFGFFVSGPGITGTQNLARLPNGQPTSINKVNIGIPGRNSPIAGPAAAYDNTQTALYLNNGHTVTLSGSRLEDNDAPTATRTTQVVAVAMSGLTKLITYSVTGLTPGGTYTFKTAIGDNNDGDYDSGVFIDQIYGTANLAAINNTETITAGGTGAVNVLTNDTFNGASPATLTDVSLSQVSTTNPGVNLSPTTGKVTVANGTPPGVYTITYQICDNTYSSNCKTATMTVTVLANLSIDSDGDGITDDIDIDDDNDGILDTVENSSCSVSSPVVYGSNLVANGSFESGNTGFTSAFTYGTCNTICGDSWEAFFGNYYIVSSACNCSGSNSGVPAWQALPHSGNNLMLVDFPASGTSNIYVKTINVKPNTRYNFSAWLINLITSGNFPDPSLKLSIQENSGTIVPIGTGANVPEAAGWLQTAYNFTTGSTTSTVTLYIQNGNSGGSGNDAGIDDISLREVFCDTDGDGIPNDLDLDSDNDGCPDAIEGGANILASQLVDAGGTLQGGNGINPVVPPTSGTYNQAVLKNLCASNTCVNAQGLPQFTPTVPTNYSNTTGQTGDVAYDASVVSNACKCFKTGATGGTVLDTKHGVTALGRAGATNGNWPMVRKGAWTALEAKSKGFVVNRVAFSAGNPVGIPAANFVEGMLVYDTTNNCLKMYTSQDNGVTFGWYCISTQTCPDIL